MNFKNFFLILLSISISLSKSHQIDTKTYIEGLLLSSLSNLQQNLSTNNTNSDEKMLLHYVIALYNQKIREDLRKRRKENVAIYWLTRRGR